MLSYPKEAIQATTDWVNDHENAKLILQKNNLEELVQLKTAAIGLEGYKKALEYLLVKKHIISLISSHSSHSAKSFIISFFISFRKVSLKSKYILIKESNELL